MPWPHSKKDNRIVERRGTSRSPMSLFLSCVGDIAHCSIGLCFITLIVLHFITRSSWSSNLSGCSEWKGTSSNSNVKDYIPHWVRTSKLNQSLLWLETMFSWTIEHDGYTKLWWGHTDVAQKRTTLSWVLDRPWWFMSAIRASGRIHGGTRKATMIWLKDRREPRSTLGWEWTIGKCYLGKSSRASKQTREAFDH
jgi:hypothetical protein